MIRQANQLPIIDSQGERTDPTTTTVLADTGVLVPGNYEVHLIASASANAQCQLQHRNAANDANVDDVTGFYVPANQTVEFYWGYFVNRDERVRVMMDQNLTGTAWISLRAQRVD